MTQAIIKLANIKQAIITGNYHCASNHRVIKLTIIRQAIIRVSSEAIIKQAIIM
jgi:hypothetical protein